MPNDVMRNIDNAAEKFYATGDVKYFNEFVKYATPIIKRFIAKACTGSNWDTNELFSILLIDMWRLFKRWVPEDGKQFHWLMLRQLRNKIINYVHKQIGRPHKICPVCSTRQKEKNALYCYHCNSPLRTSDIIISEPFENFHAHRPNYLEIFANKQIISKLLDAVKNDEKTYKILTMMLKGESKATISSKIHIAQNALNRRLRKCQGIIKTFL